MDEMLFVEVLVKSEKVGGKVYDKGSTMMPESCVKELEAYQAANGMHIIRRLGQQVVTNTVDEEQGEGWIFAV